MDRRESEELRYNLSKVAYEAAEAFSSDILKVTAFNDI